MFGSDGSAPAAQVARLGAAAADIKAAGRIAELAIEEADGPIAVSAVLATAEETA